MTNNNNAMQYKVLMARIDGQPIDTDNGFMTYSAAVLDKKGNYRTRRQVAANFNKRMESKGLVVVKVKAHYFNDQA